MRFYIDGQEVSKNTAAIRHSQAAGAQGWNENQTREFFDANCATEEGRDMIFTTTGDGRGQVEIVS